MKQTRIGLIRALLTRGASPSTVVTHLQIRGELRDCQSVLDVGCGADSVMRLHQFEHLAGIEGYAPSVDRARKQGTHHEVVQGDARELLRYFQPGQFDACVALDLIEHLPKEEGHRLIQAMEKIARRKVLCLTPNGFLPQRHAEQSDLQEHLSGWEACEMRGLGYKVAGVLGPKCLRGEYHKLKLKPESVWGVVSLLGHVFFTRWLPSRAAAILCVKTMQKI